MNLRSKMIWCYVCDSEVCPPDEDAMYEVTQRIRRLLITDRPVSTGPPEGKTVSGPSVMVSSAASKQGTHQQLGACELTGDADHGCCRSV